MSWTTGRVDTPADRPMSGSHPRRPGGAASRLKWAVGRLTAGCFGGTPAAAPADRAGGGDRARLDVEIRVGVDFQPGVVYVAYAQPVRIRFRCERFRRRCSVVFPSLGRVVTLTPGHAATVELDVEPGGSYPFELSDDAPSGVLVVAERS